MAKCVDEKIGALLHAYELKTLSEEDSERFEIHLLHCEDCFNKVAEFEKYAFTMHSSEKLKARLAESSELAADPKNRAAKLWLFRPGLLYFLIILLAIPAVYGIISFFEKDSIPPGQARFGPAQEINFRLLRSGQNNKTFTISSGRDGIINFVSRGLTEDNICLVIITDNSGKEIIRFDHFGDFDDQGVGRLVIPNESMQPGDYWLIVREITADPASDPAKYRFKIVR